MSEPTSSPSTTPKTRVAGWVRYLSIQCVLVAALFLLIELVLAAIGMETEVNSEPEVNYPERLDEFYKIAIFGGSAAEGTYCPRDFGEILEHSLLEVAPNDKVFVRNFARHGEPFHRHQAEYAKNVAGKFDLLLVYCGNNEAENWYDDSGYWRKAEYQDRRALAYEPPVDASRRPWLRASILWLRRNSRICAIGTSWKQGQMPPEMNRNYDYEEFEDERSIPANELKAIASNFEADLREICQLAGKHGTKVLLAPTTTYGAWPPSYSVLSSKLTKSDADTWRRNYAKGLELAEADPVAATEALQAAAKIDPDVAVLNYQMARIAQQQGDFDTAAESGTAAIDAEGHYFRCHSSLHASADQVAGQLDNARYLDLREANLIALKNGIAEDELFTDICHPSFLGYTIIADRLATEVAALAGWQNERPQSEGDSAADAETKREGEMYRKRALEVFEALEITASQQRRSFAENILYCFDLIHFTAYPERCETQIQQLLREMDELGQEDKLTEVFGAISRARLALRRPDLDKAAELLNVALERSPDHVRTVLELEAWNHLIGDEFLDAGVRYSKEQGEFSVVLGETR